MHLYWTAVRTWKLLTPLTADIRDVTVANGLAALQSKASTDEEGNPLLEHRVQWNPTVVRLADKFWEDQKSTRWPSIYCRQAEVDFILSQWLELPNAPPLTAIASQLRKGHTLSKANYPWEVAVGSSSGARAELNRAKAVSLICWSAQLAYNFALLEAAKKLEAKGGVKTTWQQRNQDLGSTEKKIGELFDRWRAALETEKATLAPWTDSSYWNPLGSEASRDFLARVTKKLVAGKTDLNSQQWAVFVAERERVNPAPKLSNPNHLATWSGTPEMARRWDFRWGSCVRHFVRDVENPRG